MQGKEDRKSKDMESKLEKRQEAEVRRSVGDAGIRRQEERLTGRPQEGERAMGRQEGGGARAIPRDKAQHLGSQLGKTGTGTTERRQDVSMPAACPRAYQN